MTRISKQKEGMKQNRPRRWRKDHFSGTGSERRTAAGARRVITAAGLFLLLVTCLCFAASAEERIPVSFARAGTTTAMTPLEGEALLLDGVTYVPFRAFCVQAGDCDIAWDAGTRTATASVEGSKVRISARAGDRYIRYGERYFYTVAPVRIVRDRVYVPVRPLARCLGYEVTWSAASRSVRLDPGTRPAASGVYNEEDWYWLSRIIEAESGAEPFDGKVAVGNVVLNRAASPQFPDSIWGVIFDKKYGVQFTPTVNGMIYRTPSADSLAAAAICLEGYSLSDDILYFYDPDLSGSTWFRQNCTYAFRIGGHEFYTP